MFLANCIDLNPFVTKIMNHCLWIITQEWFNWSFIISIVNFTWESPRVWMQFIVIIAMDCLSNPIITITSLELVAVCKVDLRHWVVSRNMNGLVVVNSLIPSCLVDLRLKVVWVVVGKWLLSFEQFVFELKAKSNLEGDLLNFEFRR